MLYPDSIYTARMTDQQRAWFYAEYERARKDEIAGVLFAIFLGGFGIHHFYLGRTGLGILYLAFCWTGIPHLIGFIEAFLMPERVRAYNVNAATLIANGILAYPSPPDYRQPTTTAVPA
jgi:TM2 domain-containing membrane protein YozV